ncbi:MAG: aminoglycoside phosphotransferase family protein [Nitrospirae bacterium]|nr:aminoglycoside phosphotransferase family protein [Nitrospirota bacterium]
MPRITLQAVTAYLESLYSKPVRVLSMTTEGKQESVDDLKAFGYGSPLFLDYEVSGERKKAVLETMTPSSFGHDHFSDRAQAILWEHSAFNNLPRHVRSIDSGAFWGSGAMLSTGKAQEFFLLTDFVQGNGYFKDLERIRKSRAVTDGDIARTLALSDYLVEIHSAKLDSPGLYTRRIRDLLGHGECIMGLIDNYPPSFEFIDQPLLKKIELACIEWRWRIKHRTHRLCRVHGDFHPYNILFRDGTDFTLLDRSRGEWGEPADDTTCLSINYLFSSLMSSGKLDGPFEKMFMSFWDNYLSRTNDQEMLEVAAPFFAWRGLVIASPVWYPHLPVRTRRTIFNFIRNVLAADRFDPRDANRYLS